MLVKHGIRNYLGYIFNCCLPKIYIILGLDYIFCFIYLEFLRQDRSCQVAQAGLKLLLPNSWNNNLMSPRFVGSVLDCFWSCTV